MGIQNIQKFGIRKFTYNIMVTGLVTGSWSIIKFIFVTYFFLIAIRLTFLDQHRFLHIDYYLSIFLIEFYYQNFNLDCKPISLYYYYLIRKIFCIQMSQKSQVNFLVSADQVYGQTPLKAVFKDPILCIARYTAYQTRQTQFSEDTLASTKSPSI